MGDPNDRSSLRHKISNMMSKLTVGHEALTPNEKKQFEELRPQLDKEFNEWYNKTKPGGGITKKYPSFAEEIKNKYNLSGQLYEHVRGFYGVQLSIKLSEYIRAARDFFEPNSVSGMYPR